MSERYLRQRKIISDEQQKILGESRVLVIGAGGTGSPLLMYLACAGIGNIRIADGDIVSESNLNRQVLYTTADIGEMKELCAAKRLNEMNNEITVESVCEYVNGTNIYELMETCNLVILCVDNRKTRLEVNKACCEKNVALVDGGAEYTSGYALSVIPGITPCLSCWDDRESTQHQVDTIGTTSGIIGTLEAKIAIDILLERKENAGKMYIYDGEDIVINKITAARKENCTACSKKGVFK